VADSRRRRGAVGVVVKPEPPAAVEPDFAAHSTVDDVKADAGFEAASACAAVVIAASLRPRGPAGLGGTESGASARHHSVNTTPDLPNPGGEAA